MKNFIIVVALIGLAALSYFVLNRTQSKQLRIGIVLPMQHAALDDIVSGFKSEIKSELPEVAVEVQNAMGDINLQKSAINKFLNDKVDMIVPVATGTAQMTLHLAAATQPVLFLAANIAPDSDVAKQRPGLMGIIDEIPVDFQFKFMRAAMPTMKKVCVLYSSSEKVFDEVESFKRIAQADGVVVQKLMVQNLSDLYTVAQRVERDSDAIFILKDNLIVSGISTVVQQANHLKLPLITSDEASVKGGAAFAVGVIEADIGRQGAKIAAQFLQKAKIDKPIQYLSKISLFVNKAACEQQGVNYPALLNAATTMKLEVIGD